MHYVQTKDLKCRNNVLVVNVRAVQLDQARRDKYKSAMVTNSEPKELTVLVFCSRSVDHIDQSRRRVQYIECR